MGTRAHKRRLKKRLTSRQRLGISIVTWKGLSPRDKYLRSTYGLTERQYDWLAQKYAGGCHICRRKPKPGKRLAVDHNHKTKVVRGLLCFRCNHRLLGRGLEDPTLHLRAVEYLVGAFDARTLVDRP